MDPRKYTVEFLGTFFLVLAIGLAVIGSGPPPGFAPFAIAATLMVMIYAGGHISGAHYNPAVTLAVFIRGKCKAVEVLPYMLAQIFGAGLGAFLTLYLKGNPTDVKALTFVTGPTIIAEAVFTFALVFVILNVATAKATSGNSYYGLAIAGTVLAGAFAVGNISGCVLNPAVAVGAIVMGLVKAADVWMHLLGQVGGAVLAAVAFKGLVKD
jgi:aquaporin Z